MSRVKILLSLLGLDNAQVGASMHTIECYEYSATGYKLNPQGNPILAVDPPKVERKYYPA
jgi:hypothetical protein